MTHFFFFVHSIFQEALDSFEQIYRNFCKDSSGANYDYVKWGRLAPPSCAEQCLKDVKGLRGFDLLGDAATGYSACQCIYENGQHPPEPCDPIAEDCVFGNSGTGMPVDPNSVLVPPRFCYNLTIPYVPRFDGDDDDDTGDDDDDGSTSSGYSSFAGVMGVTGMIISAVVAASLW